MENDGRVAYSRIELILVILFVLLAMGIFALVRWAVTYPQADETLQTLKYEAAAGVPEAQAQVALLSAERDALQEALAARKAAQTQGAISLTVIAAVPTETVQPQATIEAQQTTVAQEIPLLETQQAAAVAAVSAAEVDVAEKQQTAARNRQWFNIELQGLVLLVAVATTAVVLTLVTALAYGRGVYASWAINQREVLGATAALLALLFGYAAFETIGAACGAVLVLLALALWAARRRSQL